MNTSASHDKRIDVTGIGHAVTDIIKETPQGMPEQLGLAFGAMSLLESTEQSTAILNAFGGVDNCHSVAGGSAGNTVAALAALGRSTAFIGNVADDAAGHMFAQSLEQAGTVFSRAGDVPAGEISGNCCICVTPDGERTMATYLGASRALQADKIDTTILAASSIVYAEAYLWDDGELKDIIPSAFIDAKKTGARTAFSLSDPFCVARHRDTLLAFLQDGHVDILFGNEEEITQLFPGKTTEDITDIVSGFTDVTFMTRGANGATVCFGGNAVHVAAEPVAHVVDTTGAGDLFAAGALYGILNQADYHASAAHGCAAAAHIINRIGGRVGEGFTLEDSAARSKSA